MIAVCSNAYGTDREIRRMRTFGAECAQVVDITASPWHAQKIVLDKPNRFTMLRWGGGDVDLGEEIG